MTNNIRIITVIVLVVVSFFAGAMVTIMSDDIVVVKTAQNGQIYGTYHSDVYKLVSIDIK